MLTGYKDCTRVSKYEIICLVVEHDDAAQNDNPVVLYQQT